MLHNVPMGKKEAKFWSYWEAHPEIEENLVAVCRQWRAQRGPASVVSIAMAFERLRWEIGIKALPGEPTPKISNDHKPFYARWIMQQYRGLSGIFVIKRQKIQATFGPLNEILDDE